MVKDYTALMHRKIIQKHGSPHIFAIYLIKELLKMYSIELNNNDLSDDIDWIIFDHKKFLNRYNISQDSLSKSINFLETLGLIQRIRDAYMVVNNQPYKVIKIKLLPKTLKYFLES